MMLWTAALLSFLAYGMLAQTVPVINTTLGQYRGYSPHPNVDAYLGIPYAAPPLGPLRFMPPQPFNDPANGIINATEAPKGCFQLTFNTALVSKLFPVAEAEDCLTVSVWKPWSHDPSSSSNKLPVLIWIYGGGFAQGFSSSNDGVPFVREHQDILVVSFNYRLNIFGFPTPPEDGALEKKNVGLLDQRLAIEWVRDNIARFGGDPERMVLSGQSAGSMSVAWYGLKYIKDPIVSGLIMLSGQPEGVIKDRGGSWQQSAERNNCTNVDRRKEVKCMQRVPARELKKGVSYNHFIEYGDLTGGAPTADNESVWGLEAGIARGLSGQFAQIPVWIGHTLNEGDNTVEFDPNASGPGINYTQADQTTLAAFHCPAYLASLYRVMAKVPVYRSVYSGMFPAMTPYDWLRAYHAQDAYLLLGGDENVAWGPVDDNTVEAGRLLRQMFAAFTKDPKEGLAKLGWKKYAGEGETLMNLFKDNNSQLRTLNATAFDAPCRELYGPFQGPSSM